MNKKLVCYFSATGTTKQIASKLASIIDASLFEIEPTVKYTSEDLDWNNENSRTTLESKDEACRPAVKNKVNNILEYSEIYIGFPVWWYKEPSIIDTFLDENNFEGKKIYVFVTSGGSTYEGSLKHLKNVYSNLNFVSGKTLNYINDNEIMEWVSK